MNPDVEKSFANIEKSFKNLRRIIRKEARAKKRAALFRRLGVQTPRALLAARGRLVERKFDGRGLRRRDRAALGAINWLIDRCQMLEMYGELGDVFRWRVDG